MSSFKNGVFDKIRNELLDVCKKYSLEGDDLFKFLQYVFRKELLSIAEKELETTSEESDSEESDSEESESESVSEKDKDIDIKNKKLSKINEE